MPNDVYGTLHLFPSRVIPELVIALFIVANLVDNSHFLACNRSNRHILALCFLLYCIKLATNFLRFPNVELFWDLERWLIQANYVPLPSRHVQHPGLTLGRATAPDHRISDRGKKHTPLRMVWRSGVKFVHRKTLPMHSLL